MIKLSLIGAEAMLRKLSPKTGIISDGASRLLKDLTLAFERDVKKATVVDTGRLRASITSNVSGTQGEIMTNVKYAPFVEYGTRYMEARHMEGASKVLGEGMFHYVTANFKRTADGIAQKVATIIEGRWRKG